MFGIRYNIINANTAEIVATIDHLDSLVSASKFLHGYAPILPQLKLETALLNTLLNCQDIRSKKIKHLMLHIVVAAMSSDELEEFQQFLSNLQHELSFNSIKFESSHLHSDFQSTITAKTTCKDASKLSSLLSEHPKVLWIEEKMPISLLNRWAKGVCQSGSHSSTPMYYANLTGFGQTVGISDTGIDMTHCYFFDPNVATPYDTVNTAHRKVVTYITKYGDEGDDSEAHGTHVSGIAAGVSASNYGDYQRYSGVAYNAKIAFLDIEKSSAGFLTSIPDLYSNLFTPLYTSGARVFSNSWGSTASSGASAAAYTADAVSVDKFMWDHPDSLIMFAAGNTGVSSTVRILSPSTNKNGVCVGASFNDYESWQAVYGINTDTGFNVDKVANFSCRGPTNDGRLKPDIVAPGAWVTSALGIQSSSSLHCDLKLFEGTSQATPAAAGNAILVREYFMRGFYPSGQASAKDGFVPSGALIKAILLHSGQKMSAVAGHDVNGNLQVLESMNIYPNNIQGYGRIQLDAVLNFGKATRKPLTLFVVGAAYRNSTSLYATLSSTGSKATYVVSTSSDTSELRVTLAYTDMPGVAGSAKPLINDLDVSVIQQSNNERYLPLPNNANSRIDNVEMIIISDPVPYTNYTVTVTAYSLSTVQPYALVITGNVIAVNASLELKSEIQWSKPTGLNTISVVLQQVIGAISAGCFTLLFFIILIRCMNKKAVNMSDLDDIDAVQVEET